MRWGFVDHAGIWVIEPTWDEVGGFSEGRAWVIRDGKVGYIDRRGEVAIPLAYKEAWPFSGGLAKVSPTGGTKYVIDRDGQTVYDDRDPTVAGLTPVARWDEAAGQRRWGIVDTDGRVVVEVAFQRIWRSDGFAICRDFDGVDHVFDSKGSEVFTVKRPFFALRHLSRLDGYWIAQFLGEPTGDIHVMDDCFQVLHELRGDSIMALHGPGARYRVTTRSDTSIPEAGILRGAPFDRYFDAAFNAFDPPEAQPEPVTEGRRVRIEVGRRKHHIFIDGEAAAGGPFDDSLARSPLVWIMKKTGKEKLWGAVDECGQLVIPIEHGLRDFAGPYCVLGSLGKVGLVGEDGAWILAPSHTAVRVLGGDPARVAAYVGGRAYKNGTRKGGAWDLRDAGGEVVLGPTFADIGRGYDEGLLAAARF